MNSTETLTRSRPRGRPIEHAVFAALDHVHDRSCTIHLVSYLCEESTPSLFLRSNVVTNIQVCYIRSGQS
ncbi:hypothetical protein Y032_0019g3874 [Ancylostoma ceylanicum]|uniref:Uncharacterized protein n=1 Tax=Ancylostoma ceylanicum TaxID=53326 RepID=A0A016V3E7_9BILA|nr:hypothetical protein Y032_0019g3874 [Ancylostoma ceylanicum]